MRKFTDFKIWVTQTPELKFSNFRLPMRNDISKDGYTLYVYVLRATRCEYYFIMVY